MEALPLGKKHALHVSDSTNSFVLAATEHLYRHIACLSGRIRQLEDALSACTRSTNKNIEPHPLLHEYLIHAEVEEIIVEGGGAYSYTEDKSGEGYYWAPMTATGAAGSASGSGPVPGPSGSGARTRQCQDKEVVEEE